MANMSQMRKKLMNGLNSRGYKLTFGSREFIGIGGEKHQFNTISKAVYNEITQRYDHIALYSSPSMLRIVMYLRDMWFIENGLELPTDQEVWNKARAKLIEEGNEIYG